MTAALEVVGASVDYGDRRALADVDLTVDAGEVVAVLGPSGSGKSTLLRAVAGLVPLATGAIRAAGRDLAGVPVHQRGVGLMFQEHALFPHRDVAGNVGYGLEVQGRTRAEARAEVARLLELVGLPGAERRPVHELSGGEQQRVALARALAPAPAVLLLDEPLGALDRLLRDRLAGELRRIFTEHHLTVVAVTHDQAEAFALADRIAVVDAGRLVQVGAPPEVWAAPRSRRVAELLGLTNLVGAEVRAGRADSPWGELPATGRADGSAAIVVRPEGVRLVAEGRSARVVERTFRGATTIVDLALEGTGSGGAPLLRAEVASAGAPARGDLVQIAIDADAVVAVDP